MTSFELVYLCAEPFLPPLQKRVRRWLRTFVRSRPQPPKILDVGGRKSHYTIGVTASITITDLPRETEVQQQLNLGLNDAIVAQTKARRTNVCGVLFDDMTRSALPDGSFDCVVAVEVLEHVDEDARFIEEVHRVLKPGGVFLMTTPNGDFCVNTNPDHKRHYTLAQLQALLASCFGAVEAEYAIQGGTFQRWGLASWSVKRPARTLLSMLGNVANTLESARPGLRHQPRGTHHLVAVARKQC